MSQGWFYAVLLLCAAALALGLVFGLRKKGGDASAAGERRPSDGGAVFAMLKGVTASAQAIGLGAVVSWTATAAYHSHEEGAPWPPTTFFVTALQGSDNQADLSAASVTPSALQSVSTTGLASGSFSVDPALRTHLQVYASAGGKVAVAEVVVEATESEPPQLEAPPF